MNFNFTSIFFKFKAIYRLNSNLKRFKKIVVIYDANFYSLDVVISEDYRVNSKNAAVLEYCNSSVKKLIIKHWADEKELKGLNLMVGGFLTPAELRALNEIPMAMADWKKVLDACIDFNKLFCWK